MKRLGLTLAFAALASGYTAVAGAQSSPPPLPQLSVSQTASVQHQLDLYRTEINGRVARGEISADEGDRLLQWREWQIAQQVAGLAPPPGPILEQAPRRIVREYYYAPPPLVYAPPPVVYAPPYYGPYYGFGPYWGARICAGGWGHHFGGRFCF